MTTHTIATAWVKIDGEDRLRIGIDLEHDFATIYLRPETVDSLRIALDAIPERLASGPRFWDVVIDGSKPIRAVGDNEDDAIKRAAIYIFTDLVDVVHIEGDEFEGTSSPEDHYFLPSRSRFTATATLAPAESK